MLAAHSCSTACLFYEKDLVFYSLWSLMKSAKRQNKRKVRSFKKIIYELYENGEGSLLLGVAAARSKSRFILS